MKRLYSTPDYKQWHNSRLVGLHKKSAKKASRRNRNPKKRKTQNENAHKSFVFKPPVYAPSDLRLIENLDMCLEFFRDLRSEHNFSYRNGVKAVVMSLKYAKYIDYGTISVLTSLNDELRHQRIILQTILPDDEDCKKFMIDSGYLNNLMDERGRPFPQAKESELIFFEKGSGYLSNMDSQRISQIVKNVVGHLTNDAKYSQSVRTIILEICGNSIEWSGTETRQWLLGVKYEPNRVIFTVTDVGRGILDTLYRKFTKRFFGDIFKSSDEILKGAFDKKYGSSTREVNRNKGLPAVKENFMRGNIHNLKVITNNVILHFDDDSKSREFKKGSPRFKGTFYQWEMTRDCLTSLIALK